MYQEHKGDAKGTQGIETKTTPAATELWDVQKYLKGLEEKSLTTLDLSLVRIKSYEGQARPIKTFEGHSSLVAALTVLPDNRVVSGSFDNTLKVWDLKSGECVGTWKGHKNKVYALGVLPDSRVVSGSYDDKLKVWDVKRGECVATWKGHKDGVSAVAVLSDTRVVSGSYDNTLKVWDVNSGVCVATWKGHTDSVSAIAVLPDGCVVSGSKDETIKVWDVKQGKCVATWEEHKDSVSAVVVLPDGRVVSGSSDKTLKVWDVKSGVCVATWKGHKEGVRAVGVLPDACLVSGSEDGTLKIWDVKQGKCIATWEGHKSGVYAVAVLADGRVVSGSFDDTLKVWEFPTRGLFWEDLAPLLTQLKTDRILTALNLSQQKELDDKAVLLLFEVLSSNKTLRHLDLRETGISFAGIKLLYQSLKGHPLREGLLHEGIAELVKAETLVASVEKTGSEEVKALSRIEHKGDAKGTDGIETKPTLAVTELWNVQKYLKALEEKSLTTLDLSHVRVHSYKGQARGIKTFKGHSYLVTALTVLPDNRVVSGSLDKMLKIWDVKRGACVRTWECHGDSVYALALLPDGRVVSGSRDKTLNVSDVERGECVATWMGHKDSVYALALLADGRVVSGSRDKTLKVWDVKRSECVATWEEHQSSVYALAILLDGRVVSGSEDRTLKIWDVKSGQCVATWKGHEQSVTVLAVLPDGRLVSGSEDSMLKVWDVKSGECVATWKGHKESVTAVAVLPDGGLVSASEDKTLKIWDVNRGVCVGTWEGHENSVSALAVLLDGPVLSGSRDNTLKVWEPPTRGLLLEDLAPLLTALKTDRTLTALNLSQQSGLDDKATLPLLELLSQNKTLTELDIRGTGISATSAHFLYEAPTIGKRIHHEALPSSKSDVRQDAVMPENKGESKTEKKADSSSETKGDQKTSITVSYTLNYNDLTLDPEIIGHGGYGDVYKATWRREDGSQIVAVKQLKTPTSKLSSKALEEFKKESELMARLKSDYIIKFYGYCVNPRCCILMEYMPKGSLFDLMSSGQVLEWSIRYRIASDMAQGLKYLHDNHILHRDFKSLNVLLDQHFRARLCDFGLSKIKNESCDNTTQGSVQGTAAWMAPELTELEATFTKKSDMYSFGMVLWELAANKLPFAKITGHQRSQIPRWVAEGKLKETIPGDCPKKIASLIRFCWEIKPDNRPTATQAAEFLELSKDDDYADFVTSSKLRKQS